LLNDERKLTIYLPADLKAQLAILPPRSVSGICQDALRKAVADRLAEAAERALEAFAED